MQRSAAKRIGDLLGVAAFGFCVLYDVLADIKYVAAPLVQHQPLDWLSGIVFLALTVWISWLFGIQIWTVRTYRTPSWFVDKLRTYVPLLFWHVLFSVAITWVNWGCTVAGWLSRKRFGPERGMTLKMGFDDEQDYRGVLRALEREGAPITYDSDILQSFPITSRPARIIPADGDEWHDELL